MNNYSDFLLVNVKYLRNHVKINKNYLFSTSLTHCLTIEKVSLLQPAGLIPSKFIYPSNTKTNVKFLSKIYFQSNNLPKLNQAPDLREGLSKVS